MLTSQGVSRYVILQCNSRTAFQSVPVRKRKLVLFNPSKTRGWRDSPSRSPSCCGAWILLLHLLALQYHALPILLALCMGAEPDLGGEWRENWHACMSRRKLMGRIPPAPSRQASSRDVLTQRGPLVTDRPQATASVSIPVTRTDQGITARAALPASPRCTAVPAPLSCVPSLPRYFSPPTSLRSSCIRQVLMLSQSHRE